MSGGVAPATPLPWGTDVNAGKVCIGPLLTLHNGTTFVDIGSDPAALYIAYDESGEWCVSLCKQDAAYLVHAANCHPDLVEALVDAAASLAATVSLLERGGKAAKKAAPSDKMFGQMLRDYKASLERARAALAKAQGGAK